MKKKIIGLLVCVVLIVTVVPDVRSLHDKIIPLMIPSNSVHSCSRADWFEMQKVLAGDGAAGGYFGYSVSVDGDTALIGAHGDGSEWCSAYVFIRSGTTWMQEAKLLALDGVPYDEFGWSVSLSGDTALIGAWYDDDNGPVSGSAYVFIRTGTTWTQQAKLLASDGATLDQFGYSVSLSDDTAFIGANLEGGTGSAYVFTRTGTIWTQQAKLIASDAGVSDSFGCSVFLHGDTAVIGALLDDDNGLSSGSAYVFTRTGTVWTQQMKLLASDGAAGYEFGSSVSLSGDSALIGARFSYGNVALSGSAYVFIRTGTTWTQQAKLLTSDGASGDSFGASVSLDGDTALIGASQDDDNGGSSGSAYVFTRAGTSWSQQQKLLASDGAAGDEFGFSVSLSGDIAFIGAPYDDDIGLSSGSSYVFMRESENLPPLFGTPIPANSSINIPLGFSWSIPISDSEGDTFSWSIQCSNGQSNSATGATNGTKTLALSSLAYATTYKVWVNATDPTGSGLYTRRWFTFTTQQQQNSPPNKPNKPSGPPSGKPNTVYTYSTSTTDPDGNQVYYQWDWGDGSQSNWLGPYNSGATVSTTHTWGKGSYSIKVKAKDTLGAESAWSDPLSVTMPFSYHIILPQFFQRLFEHLPNAFLFLRYLLYY